MAETKDHLFDPQHDDCAAAAHAAGIGDAPLQTAPQRPSRPPGPTPVDVTPSSQPRRTESNTGRKAFWSTLLGLTLFLIAPSLAMQGRVNGAELPTTSVISVEPAQSPAFDVKPWKAEDYTIRPLSSYDLTARVLGRRDYSGNRMAEVSPMDLALGWNRMADRDLLQNLEVRQRDRWYFVKWQKAPIKAQEVISSSANTHILPANDRVTQKLGAIRTGDIVHLGGYLVHVSAEDGWSWASSTTREDTGDGSCEVFWVDEVQVFPEEPIRYASFD
jgi:hypothetical protein